MSCSLTCRYCDEEFTPQANKSGYYDVCQRCTARQLALDPDLEPEPLRAGVSIDESGTFDEIVPAHSAWTQTFIMRPLGVASDSNADLTGSHRAKHKNYQPPK